MIVTALAIGSAFAGLAVTLTGQVWVSATDRDGQHVSWGMVGPPPHVERAPDLWDGRLFARPDGGAWLIRADDSVVRLNPDGSGSAEPVAILQDDAPQGLATVAADSSLEITGSHKLLLHIAPDGTQTQTPLNLPWNGKCRLSGVTSAPDGSLWFADTGCRRLIHTAPGQPTTVTSTAPYLPDQLVAPPDGSIWFSLGSSGLGRRDPSGALSHPIGDDDFFGPPVLAADGSVWTADACDLVHFTPTGVTRSHASFPVHDFAIAADGSAWVEGAPRLAHLSAQELASAPAPKTCDFREPTVTLPDAHHRDLSLNTIRRKGIRIHVDERSWVRGVINWYDQERRFARIAREVKPGTFVVHLTPAQLAHAGGRGHLTLEVQVSATDRAGNEGYPELEERDDGTAEYDVR